jgi:hypothetical protein
VSGSATQRVHDSILTQPHTQTRRNDPQRSVARALQYTAAATRDDNVPASHRELAECAWSYIGTDRQLQSSLTLRRLLFRRRSEACSDGPGGDFTPCADDDDAAPATVAAATSRRAPASLTPPP